MYFGCCIYVLLLLNMPEMAHDWINKSILFYSILFYSNVFVVRHVIYLFIIIPDEANMAKRWTLNNN